MEKGLDFQSIRALGSMAVGLVQNRAMGSAGVVAVAAWMEAEGWQDAVLTYQGPGSNNSHYDNMRCTLLEQSSTASDCIRPLMAPQYTRTRN